MSTTPCRRLLAVAVFLCLFTGPASAQTATVIRNVNLRLDTSTEQAPIRLLRPNTTLALLDRNQEDGYYHVRTAEGQEGWVWVRNVRIDDGIAPFAAAIPSVFSPTWEKPAPNKSSFTGPSGSCGWAGVGDESASNQRKNRTDLPTTVHDVTFRALADLPYPKGPKERSHWTSTQLEPIAKFEGTAVRVKGFLVAVRPQTGSAEGTNCRFTKAEETDWHMALVEHAGDGEHDAVVVETTPRIKRSHPKWTKARLVPWTDTNQPVRITGWVFFDSEHRNHLKKYRSTLWEIHPITKIEVFKGNKWVSLDDVP